MGHLIYIYIKRKKLMGDLSGILSLCLPGFTTQLILFSEGKKMAYSPRGECKALQ